MRAKTKNKILKTVTAFAVVTWILSACALDSTSNAPLIVCAVDTAWLALFALANAEG